MGELGEREIMRESFVTSAGSLGLNALKTLRVITNFYWKPLPLDARNENFPLERHPRRPWPDAFF